MKIVKILAGSLLILLVLIFSVSYLSITKPTEDKLALDSRNEGISINAHYKYHLLPQVLTLNLNVEKSKAPIDIARVLFVTAEALKDKRFETVELAYDGTTKFLLKGDYFQTLGTEYETQNPMYIVRTLLDIPTKVRQCSATKYPIYSGAKYASQTGL